MKKIFLTTAAALVASGGAFAMEGGVAFTGGEAKFGMQYDEQHTDMEAQFFHDLDFKMGASGTTDDGIGFSANVKLTKMPSLIARFMSSSTIISCQSEADWIPPPFSPVDWVIPVLTV